MNQILETESVLGHKKSEKWGTIFFELLVNLMIQPLDPETNISRDILHKSWSFFIVPGFHHFLSSGEAPLLKPPRIWWSEDCKGVFY